MVLQNILFPGIELSMKESLFFRASSENVFISLCNHQIIIPPYTSVNTSTYFNSFSVSKWKKYTKVNNIKLVLKLQGSCSIKLQNITSINNLPYIQNIAAYECNCSQLKEEVFEFPEEYTHGILSFEINALSSNVIFGGGKYYTDINGDEINNINIAIAMCTYKREFYVEKNMTLLKNYLQQEPRPIFTDHISVYIADNGQTLESSNFDLSYTKIISNANTGGSGGFTCAFLEILKDYKNKNITHILTVDDDILLSPHVLERTYIFLSVLKEQYKNSFIGSSFLDINKQNIQVEIGGIIRNGQPVACGVNKNLEDLHAILINDRIANLDYLGWWYCIIPITCVKEGLPLPLFIKRDDIEFSLRWNIPKIVLNGICVWHEPYLKKFNFSTQYYNARNNLIMNAIHNPNLGIVKKELLNTLKIFLLTYRYTEASLYLKGIEDFLKGPEWLKNNNAIELHNYLRKVTPHIQQLDELNIRFEWGDYLKNTSYSERKGKKWLRRLTLNGSILSGKHFAIVPIVGAPIGVFWRVKRAFYYNFLNDSGYFSQKDNKTAIRLLGQAMKIYHQLSQSYECIVSEYKTQYKELVSEAFWQQYLNSHKEQEKK